MRGTNTRFIPIKTKHRFRRQTPQKTDLLLCERGPQRGDDRVDPRLSQRHNIHIAFNGNHHATVISRLAGLSEVVEQPSFMKKRCLRRIHVFGLRGRVERPPAKRHNTTTRVGNRKHDPVTKPVIGFTNIFTANQQSGLDHLRQLEIAPQHVGFKARPVIRCKPDPEPVNRLRRQSPPGKIGPRLSPLAPLQAFDEIILRRRHDIIKIRALFLARCLARVTLGHLHTRLCGQPLNSFQKAQIFRLFQKLDDVAMLARRKAMVELLVIIHREAGRLLIVKRRQAHKFPSLPGKLHTTAHHLRHTDAVFQLIKETLGETHLQSSQVRTKAPFYSISVSFAHIYATAIAMAHPPYPLRPYVNCKPFAGRIFHG